MPAMIRSVPCASSSRSMRPVVLTGAPASRMCTAARETRWSRTRTYSTVTDFARFRG